MNYYDRLSYLHELIFTQNVGNFYRKNQKIQLIITKLILIWLIFWNLYLKTLKLATTKFYFLSNWSFIQLLVTEILNKFRNLKKWEFQSSFHIFKMRLLKSIVPKISLTKALLIFLLRSTPSIEDRDFTRIALQKNSYFAQFSSAYLNYIPEICVILGTITTNFFRFFKKSICFIKKYFLLLNLEPKIFFEKCYYIGHLMTRLCNFFQKFPYFQLLNNAWKKLKFWVSLLFILVYQSLKFQVNQKHGVLNPSDLAWNTIYFLFEKKPLETKKSEVWKNRLSKKLFT